MDTLEHEGEDKGVDEEGDGDEFPASCTQSQPPITAHGKRVVRPNGDSVVVVVWTRALYTGLVLRDSRTMA